MEVVHVEVTLGSLFDGIAGFPEAGRQVGIKAKWASEIEAFPISVSKRHFPEMTHLGDITTIDGGEIEPVDVITFGSPCQDLSVAGKREGIEGGRSSLFYEATRIIAEMRRKTNGRYPRYAVWENVPGAFSSNKGDDFRAVIEELVEVAQGEEGIAIPMPRRAKWRNAGVVRGNGWSIAWRVLDARYFGVPQRRRRIVALVDFGSERAHEVLFEREGVYGDSTSSGEAREGAAADASIGAGSDGGRWLAGTLMASGAGLDRPAGMASETDFLVPVAFNYEDTDLWTHDDESPSLRASVHVSVVYRRLDFGKFVDDDTSSTITQREYKSPTDVVVESHVFYESGPGYVTEGFGCLRADGENRSSRPTHTVVEPVYSLQGNMIGRADKNGPAGSGVNEDVAFNVNATDVMIDPFAYPDPANTLRGQTNHSHRLDSDNVAVHNMRVRRLTPTECERLQGFADDHTLVDGASDSKRYKSLGNSIAVPKFTWLFRRLVDHFALSRTCND